MNYETTILNLLVDKYEKSKSFIEDNKVIQSFSINLNKIFPSYSDHSNYETFSEINEAVRFLERAHYIMSKKKGSVFEKVMLNTIVIDSIYDYLKRKPKSVRITAIRNLLMKYKNQHPILAVYCEEQLQRLDKNKSVLWLGDKPIKELEVLLLAVSEALKIEEETYLRDFSVRVFGDSKIFEKIADKVIGLLYAYGDFSERNRILDQLNLVKNPTYIHIKGAVSVEFKGQSEEQSSDQSNVNSCNEGNEQSIDLTYLIGDLALSASLLDQVSGIRLTANQVMTVENLTSFHTMPCHGRLVIYLGGFHNTVSRKFLKKLHEQNPEASYKHFGDIDAGGFYILEHLKKMTGIPFRPYRMDIPTLQHYADKTKPLSVEDNKRLNRFIEGPYSEVAKYMIENNCKLEQEAIETKDLSS